MKIAFVCHGNICRSPMAEFIFKQMLENKGLSGKVKVVSRATSREEIHGNIGNPIYPPARAELNKLGIFCDKKRAEQLLPNDVVKYDLFIGMDEANIRNMKRILGVGGEGKIRKLMEYTGSDADVADPWYTDRFDITRRDITLGCEALLNYLIKNEKI